MITGTFVLVKNVGVAVNAFEQWHFSNKAVFFSNFTLLKFTANIYQPKHWQAADDKPFPSIFNNNFVLLEL